MRVILFFSLFVTMVSASFLFMIKHEVVVLEREISETIDKISITAQETEILKSELSYLTNPQRIYDLVQYHLINLRPLKKEQLVPFSHLNP